MKHVLYFLSGIIFSLGLLVSGMTDPNKIINFLNVSDISWSPALIYVLGSAVLIYLLGFGFLRFKKSTFNGVAFAHPKPRPIDRKLIIGSILFGTGWGIVGVCPGPAIVHLAFPDFYFLSFIVAMIGGFEIQRRVS